MKKYGRKLNPKVIALIIEASLFAMGYIVLFILYKNGVEINYIPVLAVTLVFIFVIVVTLSRIRYDAMRDLRGSDVYQDNVPIYTDDTTLLAHNIIDETEKDKSK